MTDDYLYNEYEMDEELYQIVNRCIEMLEESVGTCSDDQLLPLIEEAHSALEQLTIAMERNGKKDR